MTRVSAVGVIRKVYYAQSYQFNCAYSISFPVAGVIAQVLAEAGMYKRDGGQENAFIDVLNMQHWSHRIKLNCTARSNIIILHQDILPGLPPFLLTTDIIMNKDVIRLGAQDTSRNLCQLRRTPAFSSRIYISAAGRIPLYDRTQKSPPRWEKNARCLYNCIRVKK